MPTAADDFRDALLSHQIGIIRLSNREIRGAVAALRRAEAEAMRRLRVRLELASVQGFDRGPFTTMRLRRSVADLRSTLAESYRALGIRTTERLGKLTEYEADYMQRAMSRTLPDQVLELGLTVGKPSVEVLRGLATNPLVTDTRLSAYFKGSGKKSLVAQQLKRIQRTLLAAVREGIPLGDPVETMIRRVRRDALAPGRRHLAAVIDTAVKGVMQDARERTLADNAGDDGVVKGFQWMSTLDLRTTKELCVPRDGKPYDMDRQPIGHSYEWGAGPGRIHWRCRSAMSALFKSWQELGIDADEITGATRASMNGAVPREVDYQTFLDGESERAAAAVLGKQRAALLKRGGLGWGDLYRDGKLVKVRQLRADHLAAFERAGLVKQAA